MGLFSFIGGMVGAGKQKSASRKADAAMLQYLDRGINEQQRQFDTTRADFAPFLETGTGALRGLGDLTGLNGGGVQASAIEALKASPLFQSLFRTGEEAVLQNASATGGLRGGNTQRGLADFGFDTLARVIQEQLSNLGGLAGMGQGAAGSIGAFGANKANAVSDMLGQQGATKYSGLLTRGGISAGMWKNAGSFLDEALAAALGAGAGPGGAKFNPSMFMKSVF